MTKHSLNRACVLLFWEEKLLHVSLWQSTSASTSKLYSYNTSIGSPVQNSMFRTPVDGFFLNFLRAQTLFELLRVKLYWKWPEGKRKLVRVSGRFELSRVRVTEGKITVNVWRKSRGNRLRFKLARVDCNNKFCRSTKGVQTWYFAQKEINFVLPWLSIFLNNRCNLLNQLGGRDFFLIH